MVAASIHGHVTAVFNAAGSIHVPKNASQSALLSKPLNPTLSKDLLAAPLARGARGLSTPIANTAAIALSGSKTAAARPPTRQARREAQKTVEKLSPDSKVSRPALAGAVLQLMSRMFAAVGLIIQRAATVDNPKVLLWRVGLATYVASAAPDMLSYLLAPQAVLTVLSSVEPLLVSVLAALLLPQDSALLTSQQSLATLMIVAGTLGSVLFAPVGGAALHGTAANAVTGATNGIWDVTQGAERLFEPSGAHRLLVYLCFVVPLWFYLARQVYKHKMAGLGVAQLSNFWLMLVAAMSLALLRLTLGMLGVSLHAVHSQPLLMLESPAIIGMATLALVCMTSCIYHVCQSVSEVPPHIFVPLYCATSSLLQLFHSMAIMREFRNESMEKVLLTLSCAALSLLGIIRLCTAQGGQGLKAAGPLGTSSYTNNCLEPLFWDPNAVLPPLQLPLKPAVARFNRGYRAGF